MVDITIKTWSKSVSDEIPYNDVNCEIHEIDFELVTDEGVRIVGTDEKKNVIFATEICEEQTIKFATMILEYYKMYEK